MSGAHLSKDFFELIKNIGESRSKQEEDKIVLKELRNLKEKMKEKSVSSKKMKELCIRMIYVEMLGHDAQFGYINAVNLCCQKNLVEKRVGYLACCLCLHMDHQLMLLLINTIQKDLSSDVFLEVCMALTVVCKLISPETIPVIMPLVVKLLDHPNANVRKKAIGAMNRFYEISPDMVESSLPRCKKMLYDKDPAVMGASLIIVENLVNAAPTAHKDLTKTIVSILKQVTEHCLSRDYDYHRMPAPWIQLKLLRILAVLGDGDREASQAIYPVLREVMKRADIGINVGYAIVYECVRTVIAIYPDKGLLEAAASSISNFLVSNNHNLKYLGINALAGIVQIDAKHAVDHQMTVIDCLEDPDDTLRRKTLDLLYSMTNSKNVRVIMQKLMSFLKSTVDPFLRTELVSRITQIAEKFAPDNAWYIENMNKVFELGGDLVRPEMAHNLISLISSEEVDTNDPDNIRVYAVDTYVRLMDKPRIPDALLKVIAWILGEYGHLSKDHSREDIILSLCDTMEQLPNDSGVRQWLLFAIMKLCAQEGKVPGEVSTLIARYQQSVSVSVQQKSHEFFELLKDARTSKAALPVDKSSEDVMVDLKLSFLDGYVNAALKAGAQPYKARVISDDDDAPTVGERKAKKSTLQFQAYPKERHAPSHHSNYPTPSVQTNPAPAPSVPSNPYPTTQSINTVASPQKSSTAPPASSFFAASGGPWGANGFGNDQPAASAAARPTAQPVNTPAQTNPYPTAPNPTPQPAYQPSRSTTSAASAQPTHKQQLAAGLFAGIGGQPAPSPDLSQPVVQPAQVASTPAPQPASQPAPKQPATINLFEVDDDPTSNTTPVATNGGGPIGGLDLASLFSSTPPSQPANNGGALPGFDLMGGGAEPEVKFLKGAEGASGTLQRHLANYKKSPEILVTSGSQLHISYQRVYLPGQTLLTVFITNMTTQDIKSPTCIVKAPQGMFLRCNADPKASLQNKQDMNTQVLASNVYASHKTTTLMIGVFVKDTTCVGACKVSCEIPGSGGFGGTAVPFELSLDATDLVRPQTMNVGQFGAMWKKLPCESKDTCQSALVTTPDAFKSIVESLNMKLVKIIKTECIVSCKVITGTKSVISCLLHAKLSSGNGYSNISFMVRSPFKPLSQAVMTKVMGAC